MSRLCSICAAIPLDPEILDAAHARQSWDLGTLSRIQNSDCTLCQLIAFALYEDHRTGTWQTINFRRLPTDEIALKWSDTSGPGRRGAFSIHPTGELWLCFGCRTPSVASVDDRYYLVPYIGAQVDISRVKNWISLCSTSHRGTCAEKPARPFVSIYPGLDNLRLLDLEQDCLIETRVMQRYAALSYVWGGVSSMRLTTANKAQLLLPGSIKKVKSLLPLTLRDALLLTQRLGIRYLWIDSLCLVQNDSEDVQRGVQVMDRVYENAWLTIIAACGYDANAGLPGLSSVSRRPSKSVVEVRPGMTLGLHTSLDRLIRASAYDSRAWTFQEHILSPRTLYFVDEKVFFRCQNAEYSEAYVDSQYQSTTRLRWSSMLPEAVFMREPIFNYAIMILYYTKRSLTNQNDVLLAMAGIIRRVSEILKCRFFQGMPTAAFDIFIVFHGNMLNRRTGFPSYSWTGWRGCCDCTEVAVEEADWVVASTWIVWYKRSPSGVVNLVWDPAASDLDLPLDKNHVGYCKRQGFTSPVPLATSTTRTAPTEDLGFHPEPRGYPLLQFWTLAVRFRLVDINAFNATCHLLGKNGAIDGYLDLDGFEHSSGNDDRSPHELIVLSRTRKTSEYYVMLLEWNNSIAERRGFGIIPISMIQHSFAPGPQWKEILLA